MTTFKLRFHKLALVEWNGLDGSVKAQLKKKLAERLANPCVPSARLSGLKDCYKIKLRSLGYRLVYRVDGDEVFVTVISVGRRERNEVYLAASERL